MLRFLLRQPTLAASGIAALSTVHNIVQQNLDTEQFEHDCQSDHASSTNPDSPNSQLRQAQAFAKYLRPRKNHMI